MNVIPFSTVVSLLVLSMPTLAADAKKPAPPAESAEIAVTLAEIPVEVMRGSEPVQGLTAADFEVTEKGKPLPIVACETVDLGAAPAPGKTGTPRPALSEAARRHVFLLFDFAFSRPERLKLGIAQARTFVSGSLAPEDLVAVGVYLPRGELPLLLNFTSDRAAVDRTLATLADVLDGKEPAASDEADPLRLTGAGVRTMLAQSVFREERNFARDTLESLGSSDRKLGDFLLRNLLNHSANLNQSSVEAVAMDRIMGLTESMAALADALRPVTGRKYLSLFSEGFSISELTRPAMTISDARNGTSNLFAKLDDTLGTMRRAGWTVHAVSLSGARGFLLRDDGLFYMTNKTGGVLVEATDRFAEGMSGALRRSAYSYVLTVQADVPSDGAYHPLEVRLRQDVRHATVHHRGGYFAPLPFRRQKDVQRLADAARLVAGDEERNDLGVRAVAVPLRAGADSAPVAVVVEVPGESLLSSAARHYGLEVFGYALSEAGNSTDFFAQAVDLDSSKVGTRLAQGGVRVFGKLNLPPGQHRLRLLVRDRGTGRSSVLTLPLSLAAPSAGAAPSLAAFFLPPPQDPWLLVRSSDAAFVLHDRAVQPAVYTTVPAAGETQVVLLGHGLTGKGQRIRGRILNAAGKAVDGGTLELLALTPGGESGEPDLVLARLQAGTLPVGNYLLEVRLGNEGKPVQAATARTFAVGGERSVR